MMILRVVHDGYVLSSPTVEHIPRVGDTVNHSKGRFIVKEVIWHLERFDEFGAQVDTMSRYVTVHVEHEDSDRQVTR